MTTDTTAGPGISDDAAALDTVAGLLAARRLGTRAMRVLKITGTRTAATADLAITADGAAAWHYHACDGTPPDPARTAAITIALLHAADPGRPECPRPGWGSWLIPHLDFLARTAALATTGHSLTATFGHHSRDYFTIPEFLTIISPARPGRGTVRIDDDGTISWHTRIRDCLRGTDGIELTAIADAIAAALTIPTLLPD